MPRRKTKYPARIVARIWDWLRKTFAIDWSKVRNKRDITRQISSRKRILQQVINGQRTLKGTTKQQATRELNTLRSSESEMKNNTVYKKGFNEIRPIIRNQQKYHYKGQVKFRTVIPWTDKQRQFVSERPTMQVGGLQESFYERFGFIRSESSLKHMQRHYK